jgi:hypothetical protein
MGNMMMMMNTTCSCKLQITRLMSAAISDKTRCICKAVRPVTPSNFDNLLSHHHDIHVYGTVQLYKLL